MTTVRPGQGPAAEGPAGTEDPAPDRDLLRRALAQALRDIVRDAERRLGRSIDKAALARRTSVSRNSVYAYLDGRRLPPAAVLETLLMELDVDVDTRRRLGELRDRIADHRRAPTGPDGAEPEPEPADPQPAPADAEPGDPEAGDPQPADAEPGDPQPAEAPAGRPRGRVRSLLRTRTRKAVAALAVLAACAGGGLLVVRATAGPQAVVRKGASAVGHVGKSGGICTDPSCAYLVVELHRFRPHHTYLVTCRSDGGMDPLENRNGFYTLRISTDGRGDATLADPSSCLWGYQATHVWVTVRSSDGIPDVDSDPVPW